MKIVELDGRAAIKGVSFEEIAREYGTPFYLYDPDEMKSRIRSVRKALGDGFDVLYAVKANSNLEILRALKDDLDGLDVSSHGEIEQAILAGYRPEHLSFAGPGKTKRELESSVRMGVGISVESMAELRTLRDLAAETGSRSRMMLRLNPTLLTREFTIKMGGRPSQFGIDEERAGDAFGFISINEKHLDFQGIHVYAGTQCMSEKAIAANIDNTLALAANLGKEHGIARQRINLGGGFGVSYYEPESELDLSLLGSLIHRSAEGYVNSAALPARFILELGRYIVAEAGIYVARVVGEKESKGEMFYVIDGGMNHHLAASGNLGATLRKNYVAVNLSRINGRRITCNIVGPLCTPLDVLGKNLSIAALCIGDLIGILKSGSYGFTASPLLFLGHETPVELMLCGRDIRVIRKPRALKDFN